MQLREARFLTEKNAERAAATRGFPKPHPLENSLLQA